MWSFDQRGVQVIEPWSINSRETTGRLSDRGDFGVCALVCAKAVARQHPFANHQLWPCPSLTWRVVTGRYPTEDIQLA